MAIFANSFPKPFIGTYDKKIPSRHNKKILPRNVKKYIHSCDEDTYFYSRSSPFGFGQPIRFC